MAVTKLNHETLEKVWGRTHLPPPFAALSPDERIGEVWYQASTADAPLLVKYLFTSERLSIQVHPSDAAAQARGCPRGKDEAWLIIDAEPGATIGIGLREEVDAETLRRAALDGSIEGMVEWRPVKAGDFFYSPAGTIHAIGAGVSLIEIQQNCDITYRLYDYGRPRELHLEDGLSVADRRLYQRRDIEGQLSSGRTVLTQGSQFVIEQQAGARDTPLPATPDRKMWIIPVSGSATVGATAIAAGEVWLLDEPSRLETPSDASVLIAYPGGTPIAD